ncbi:hypothetical protein AAFN86_27695 [Roseomonas sp. CAU 1739]|uniref:hypothetical protein n=1 Tax=Roseomonas sp. CAU 1739 TaxID=3140364 RepID=UPI00325C1163
MQNHGLSPEGRWAMALGVVALMIGLGAAAGGAFIGFGATARMVALPAGLPAVEPETVAIFMSACGALTMLLGVISIYKANDI